MHWCLHNQMPQNLQVFDPQNTGYAKPQVHNCQISNLGSCLTCLTCQELVDAAARLGEKTITIAEAEEMLHWLR